MTGFSFGGCCHCRPKKFYRDALSTKIGGANFEYINDLFDGVTTLKPATSADLEDCNVYLINAWGAIVEFPPTGGYDVWDLSSTNSTVIADWVAAGGKLIVCVDFKDFLSGGVSIGKGTTAAYAASLNTLLSDCGSGLSVTATDCTFPIGAPSTDTFSSSSLTSGITGLVSYDNAAGSTSSGGTLVFNSDSQNQIRFDSAGSGLVVLFNSRNTMWGFPDSAIPPDYTAMEEFLQRIIDL